MKVRGVVGLFMIAFGIIGAVLANSVVYLARGGAAYGNPLMLGILSVGVAIVGIVLLIAWMFSELTGPSTLATPARAAEPVVTAESRDMVEAGTEQ